MIQVYVVTRLPACARLAAQELAVLTRNVQVVKSVVPMACVAIVINAVMGFVQVMRRPV